MIETHESEHYKKEILEQIKEYKEQKEFSLREAGIALYMKTDIFGQFGILSTKDAAELLRKIVKEFGLDMGKLEAFIV